jgi:hypothetical protein
VSLAFATAITQAVLIYHKKKEERKGTIGKIKKNIYYNLETIIPHIT